MSVQAVDNPEERARLRALSDEIGVLLARHDVAGFVALVAPDSAEYRFCLLPTWSCLSYETDFPDGSVQVRFKANVASGGPEERKRANATMGMLIALTDLLGQNGEMVAKLAAAFGGRMGEVEHISQRIR